MRVEVKYRLAFGPGREDLLQSMKPIKFVSQRVGQFASFVDEELTRFRFSATPEVDGFYVSMFELHFQYSAEEMAKASVFQITAQRSFVELTYDEKTAYDESDCCPFDCGYGRFQLGPMVLPQLAKRRFPPFFRHGGGQFLCSHDFAREILLRNSTTEYTPVFSSVRSLSTFLASGLSASPRSDIEPLRDLPGVVALQLNSASTVDLSADTKTGVDPYREGENPFPCPLGHIFGYRQISPLVVKPLPEPLDLAFSKQLWGTHSKSSFWPRQELLASRSVSELFLEKKIKYIDVIPVYSEDGTIL